MLFLILIALALIYYISVNVGAEVLAKSAVYSSEDGECYDAILVLGTGIRGDGSPSNMLEDRLLAALELFRENAAPAVIVSGDHGRVEYDEVNVMKDYLVKHGVPSDCVYMDHAGFSTYDSLYRAKAVFGAESLVIVTQAYHTGRALMIGVHLDLDCKAAPAPILSASVESYPMQPWYSFRETLARCKDYVFCLFKPNPTYLGDPISLLEGGDVTNDK